MIHLITLLRFFIIVGDPCEFKKYTSTIKIKVLIKFNTCYKNDMTFRLNICFKDI